MKIDELPFHQAIQNDFKRGVNMIGQIGEIVPPKKKSDWWDRCMNLLHIQKFESFEHAIYSLDKHYPNAKNFLRWYLSDTNAAILFPSCKDLNPRDMQRFERLSDNTNGQEGMGGFL